MMQPITNSDSHTEEQRASLSWRHATETLPSSLRGGGGSKTPASQRTSATRLAEGEDLFTGEIWLAKRATELGLIDGVGHLIPTLKERFGEKVKIKRYGDKRGMLSRIGMQVTQDAVQGIEERAAFARFGI